MEQNVAIYTRMARPRMEAAEVAPEYAPENGLLAGTKENDDDLRLCTACLPTAQCTALSSTSHQHPRPVVRGCYEFQENLPSWFV